MRFAFSGSVRHVLESALNTAKSGMGTIARPCTQSRFEVAVFAVET